MPAKEKIRQEAEERSAPAPTVVYEAIYLEGKDELERGTSALFLSALAAGLSMGFSLITEGLLRAGLPDTAWRPLVSKLGYSMGFLIVVLGRQQLFTENTLTVMLPFLNHKNRFVLAKVLRLWGIVVLGNLLGALVIAWVIGHTAVFDAHHQAAMIDISKKGMDDPFGTILLRGIFAGWLIALMVWLMPASQSARVLVIILITYVVGLAELAHVIAGSVDKLLLVTTGQMSVGGFLMHFLLPALFGNIIGGVSLVAALNHGAAGRAQTQASA
ncbi:MAG TPA: formate/nitrite transporter family protein [Myxococcales bacterium]|jgi:formate/nitrite transporter FocA (FNT family)